MPNKIDYEDCYMTYDVIILDPSYEIKGLSDDKIHELYAYLTIDDV